jgi:hypothetical protein
VYLHGPNPITLHSNGPASCAGCLGLSTVSARGHLHAHSSTKNAKLDTDCRLLPARPPACLPAVNVPGTYIQYDPSGTPSAVTCPQDTYSPGFRKQRACVSCPPGFTTRGNNSSTSSSACGVWHNTSCLTVFDCVTVIMNPWFQQTIASVHILRGHTLHVDCWRCILGPVCLVSRGSNGSTHQVHAERVKLNLRCWRCSPLWHRMSACVDSRQHTHPTLHQSTAMCHQTPAKQTGHVPKKYNASKSQCLFLHVSVCIHTGVPAGYFLQGPGQVAPCPVGEYSTVGGAAAAAAGAIGACQRCPTGVTTLAEASASIAACTGMWPH